MTRCCSGVVAIARGLEWQQTTRDDETDLKVTLPKLLDELPLPANEIAPKLSLIFAHPLQGKQLLRCFRRANV